MAPRITRSRHMLAPHIRCPSGRLLWTSAENDNVNATLLQMREAAQAGDQAKTLELLEKLRMLAKVQIESEKVENTKWARKYVTHSWLLWFISLAVGWRAICAVQGSSELLTFPINFNITFNNDGVQTSTSARLDNASPDEQTAPTGNSAKAPSSEPSPEVGAAPTSV